MGKKKQAYMGKKKSVVLLTLLAIVIVALCALVAFPSFPIWNTIYNWEPIAVNYDFGTDLGGGYYAYYYPDGVISETKYEQDLAGIDVSDADAITEYKESYQQFGGLYLSTDKDLGVLEKTSDDTYTVTETFAERFNAFTKELEKRFEKKGYSDYRVAVVDNYSVRVELPKSETQVTDVLGKLALTGEVTLEVGGELVDELKEDDVTARDLIKSVSVANRYKATYLKVQFTAKGKAMVARVKGDLTEQSAGSSSTSKTLDIKVGDETVVQIYKDAILKSNAEARPVAVDQAQGGYVETYSILLNSALDNPLELALDVTEVANGTAVRQFAPVYGKLVVTLLYIALGVVLLATLVLPIVKAGKFGVVSAYGTLSYFIVAGICFKYITGGAFEFSLGTVLVFLAGLALMNVLQLQLYGEFKKGLQIKTMESAVKDGYKNTIWGVVDIYAVLLLCAIVLLFGGAGLYTMALQAIICIVTGAFCNLLWLRGINYLVVSATKKEDNNDDGEE